MKEAYPSLARRYFATILDVIIVIATITLIVKLLGASGVQQGPVWFVAFLPAVLYEPLLTSRYATIGQMLFRFGIRDAGTAGRISLGQAYGRLIVKFLLGAFSMITIPADDQRQAIHDKSMDTIALNTASIPALARPDV